jgi:hypothetical protein
MRKHSAKPGQLTFPDLEGGWRRAAGKKRNRGRISHLKILRDLHESPRGVADIARIYREQVLGVKTRRIQLLGRKAPARIIETLLGYEVQAHYKRIHCPDRVTARYVRLFTELGCRSIRLPYDPTVTEALIADLERSATGILLHVRKLFPTDRKLQLYVHRTLCGYLRVRLKAAEGVLLSPPENPPAE